jgi:hypothetical protein
LRRFGRLFLNNSTVTQDAHALTRRNSTRKQPKRVDIIMIKETEKEAKKCSVSTDGSTAVCGPMRVSERGGGGDGCG